MQDFKAFALKGNVIELAIGIVIGAAFGKIVSSLVNDIITPAILNPALKAAHLTELSALVIPGTAIKYGNFISEIITFTIVAFSLFLFVRMMNRTSKKKSSGSCHASPVNTHRTVAHGDQGQSENKRGIKKGRAGNNKQNRSSRSIANFFVLVSQLWYSNLKIMRRDNWQLTPELC